MKKTISLIALASMLIALFAGCGFGGRQGFELSAQELTITVGDSKVISVVPESANKKLTWTTGDSDIVTVENGTVKGKAVGSTVVTAKNESGDSASCTVTVKGKEVTNITLNNQSTTLEVGKTTQLKATVSPSDATSTKLNWSSSNGAVAVVNSDGTVTAAGAGVANIICTAENGVNASCTVTVKDSKKAESSQSSQTNQSSTYTTYYGHFRPSYVYRESDFVFPDSSIRELSRGEVEATLSGMVGTPVSGNFAQDAINEIYARNGYVFKDASIRSYYNSKPWYDPDPGFTTGDFNSTEKNNIKLLEEYD